MERTLREHHFVGYEQTNGTDERFFNKLICTHCGFITATGEAPLDCMTIADTDPVALDRDDFDFVPAKPRKLRVRIPRPAKRKPRELQPYEYPEYMRRLE